MHRSLCMQKLRRLITIRHSSTIPKVYGHYVSQPTRSVTWLLKMNNIPFDFVKVEPLKGDTRKPEYISKFPTALAPALEDDEFYVAEASAILTYLCEKYKLDKWYPLDSTVTATQQRAKINEYLSFHHFSSRQMSIKVFRPFIDNLFSGKKWSREDANTHSDMIMKTAAKFQTVCLSHGSGPYVNGMSHPTIADLMAYPEFAQISQMGIANYADNQELKQFNVWMNNMSSLPEHDNIHQTVLKVGVMGGLLKK